FYALCFSRHSACSPFPYTTLFRSYESDLPEFVVPEPFASRLWQRFNGSEYVADPPVSPDEPLGVITITTRSGEILRVTTYSLPRSEEHTSELQSRFDLVCRLLLEK